MAIQRKINIQNKKARFEFEILDKYTAGIQLTGTEIKSIRESKARITESFCEFNDRGELFIVNMYIEEYLYGHHFNHKTTSERRLLLNKKELKEPTKGKIIGRKEFQKLQMDMMQQEMPGMMQMRRGNN